MIALIVALVLEYLVGEPPAAWHPVVWMGKYLGWIGRRLPTGPPRAFMSGAMAWMLGALLCVTVATTVVRAFGPLGWVGEVIEGVLLWPMFSIRMLFSEVRGVEEGLSISLDEGRARLSRIVSRDTSNLDAVQVRESALESLSENLSDSVIAPLFWWMVLGLPGAVLYRFANTADASWGYRGEWEYKGKWAARADDVLNWVPARLTALFLGGWRDRDALVQEAGRTPSPNSGWPMAALALGLGIRLGKPGVYVLNEAGEPPTPDHTRRALAHCSLAVFYGCAAFMVLRAIGFGWW